MARKRNLPSRSFWISCAAKAKELFFSSGKETVLLDFLGNLKRTHYCGALRASDADKDVVVLGWVHRRRDLGNLLFLDVRDRTGIVQVVFNKETQPAAHAKAEKARSEFVVAVEGNVIQRQKANPDLAT